jgi:hypothetical protein
MRDESAQEPPALWPFWLGLAIIGSFGLAMYSIQVLDFYGTVLFAGVPLLIGCTFGAAGGLRTGVGRRVGLAFVSLFGVAALFLAARAEGLVCIMMALVAATPFLLLGLLIGCAVRAAQPGATRRRGAARSLFGLWLLPLVLAPVEKGLADPVRRVVMTAIEIDVPPEDVWEAVIAFPRIEDRPPWLFRLGIAAPLEAVIEGEGVGATRRCRFTTGDFVEPVTAWEPPARLAFDVTAQPSPLRELTFYDEVTPPHLDGGMRSLHGEFRLVPLPGGRTRLEGRTWFEMRLHPAAFWTPWATSIVHAIHRRVLEHIEATAER